MVSVSRNSSRTERQSKAKAVNSQFMSLAILIVTVNS